MRWVAWRMWSLLQCVAATRPHILLRSRLHAPNLLSPCILRPWRCAQNLAGNLTTDCHRRTHLVPLWIYLPGQEILPKLDQQICQAFQSGSGSCRSSKSNGSSPTNVRDSPTGLSPSMQGVPMMVLRMLNPVASAETKKRTAPKPCCSYSSWSGVAWYN